MKRILIIDDDIHIGRIVPKIQMPEIKIIRTLDRSALSRVFSNLISNAIKYSDGDLEIILSESGEVIFSNMASGLDEIQVGRLFDRFLYRRSCQKIDRFRVINF